MRREGRYRIWIRQCHSPLALWNELLGFLQDFYYLCAKFQKVHGKVVVPNSWDEDLQD